jgi:hypothetical protein
MCAIVALTAAPRHSPTAATDPDLPAAMQITARVGCFVEFERLAVPQHFGQDSLVFRFRAIAINDAIWPGHLRRFVYPSFQRSGQAVSP